MPTLVVAALSARLLAQSARRAGWDVLALDLFGDVDTRAAANVWHPIGDPTALRIDGDRFLAALELARTAHDCFGWIAGTGFEPRPDLLEAGARLLPLLGNDPATIRRVRDPRGFFTALAELSIPHPETRFDAPAETSGWLMKDFASSGGWHVIPSPACGGRIGWGVTRENAAGMHFQREIAGAPMSVLFVAAGHSAHVIGINELLARPHGTRPYVYHGVLGPIELRRELAEELAKIVHAIVQAFGLRGLGSLDFLLDGDAIQVLEVNARPPASMALYDPRFATGLVKVHVDACAGTLPDRTPARGTAPIRGELIVFTTRATRVDREHVERLPAFGCHDVPQPDSHIAPGAPLCSVSAHGETAGAVRAALAQHEAAVLAMVQNRNEAHHHAS